MHFFGNTFGVKLQTNFVNLLEIWKQFELQNYTNVLRCNFNSKTSNIIDWNRPLRSVTAEFLLFNTSTFFFSSTWPQTSHCPWPDPASVDRPTVCRCDPSTMALWVARIDKFVLAKNSVSPSFPLGSSCHTLWWWCVIYEYVGFCLCEEVFGLPSWRTNMNESSKKWWKRQY